MGRIEWVPVLDNLYRGIRIPTCVVCQTDSSTLPLLTGRNRGRYPMDTGDHQVATGDQRNSMCRGVGPASVS